MEGDKVKTENQPERRKFSLRKFLTGIFIGAIAFILGFIHYQYVSHLFENDRNFSHLSEMEREMSFRTEMGFYYSYYKTVVEERPFIAGISKIMYDRLVEYPKNVNAFNRFNIHPEVIIGAMYRYLEPWLNTSSHRECHTVDRGPGLAPVESCVGLGQPVYFYLEAIWWLAGLTVSAIFLYGTMLSESVLGGLLAVAQYFANHSECTRVQWAPNERENFAAPLLLLHSWLISMQLAKTRTIVSAFQLQVSILVLNCMCLLFWQFTQFIFLTQTAIFFVMEQLKIIDTKTLCILLHSHFCGLHLAVLLLQGNDMLKSSLYAAFFLVVSTYCLFFSSLRIKVQNRLDLLIEIILVILRISVVYIASRHLKNIISYYLEVEEDRHVWDILHSKFTDYKSFHTLIYTCSDVFDFLPWSTIRKLISTLLIPFAVISVMNVTSTWFLRAYEGCNKELEAEESNTNEDDKVSDESDSGIENSDSKHRKGKVKTDLDVIDKDTKSKDGCEQNLDIYIMFARNLKVEPAVFYNISQMIVFGIMAILVMRLKLLFVTQLCIVSSLIIKTGSYPVPKSLVRFIPYVLVLTMVPIALHLKWNLSAELSHVGEFSDIAQEELLEWIKNGSPPTAAFAGSMPLLAAVMLVTRRPIVAHPHYEHKEARDRAYIVYKTYGRYTPYELYQELSKLRAAYLIVEERYCYGRSSKGCTFQEIWEIENPQMTAAVTACHALLSGPVDHFYPVFNNERYTVFKIHDYSVQYMPRSFDT